MTTSTFWYGTVLFITVQLIVLLSNIQRENAYVAALYELQKIETARSQLEHTYTTLVNELHHARELTAVKEYAEETLALKKLPLSNFKELHDTQH